LSGGTFQISVTKDGTTYTSVVLVESADQYYAIGVSTTASLADIRDYTKNMTPEGVYTAMLRYGDRYGSMTGTFDDIVATGRADGCPNSELSRISNEMNSGKISGFGYYPKSERNIVYYVSKLPLYR